MRSIWKLALIAILCAGPILAQSQSSSFVNSRSHDSEELAADLPGRFHIKNIGSRIDGSGMCVNSSIEMAATWAGMDEWKGFRDWCADREPGGSYPEKVDRQIAAYAKAKGLAVPKYVQYQGPNPDKILALADKTGRMACMTYGWSPRYGMRISHMVCCAKFGGQYGVVLDNNFPGEDKYEWMGLNELVRRVKYPGQSGWVFVWLQAAPPPVPFNPKGK
jgi:hypothetical protein